jgi:N-acetylglucosaminyl-diphospho-decaprenol L-rhamnosyltransferase
MASALAPSIDVVIPVHDNLGLTEGCLRHLAAQSVPARVIVYDDASTDGTAQQLATAWPRVTVVSDEGQVGFASAVNRGARAGQGETIVLLNNDVEVDRDFLARLTEPLGRRPELGSVASVMLQPGGRLIDSVGLTCDSTLAAYPRLHGLDVAHVADAHPVLTGPAGAAAAYRRTAWEEMDGLDEAITAYMEDFDLDLRLRSAGWQTTAAHDAVGIHLGSASYGRRSAVQRRHGGFARGYLLRRYGILRSRTAPRAVVTEALVVAADALVSRDLAALRGRLAGVRAAAAWPRHPAPPPVAIEPEISFRHSLALRRGVYGGDQGAG